MSKVPGTLKGKTEHHEHGPTSLLSRAVAERKAHAVEISCHGEDRWFVLDAADAALMATAEAENDTSVIDSLDLVNLCSLCLQEKYPALFADLDACRDEGEVYDRVPNVLDFKDTRDMQAAYGTGVFAVGFLQTPAGLCGLCDEVHPAQTGWTVLDFSPLLPGRSMVWVPGFKSEQAAYEHIAGLESDRAKAWVKEYGKAA